MTFKTLRLYLREDLVRYRGYQGFWAGVRAFFRFRGYRFTVCMRFTSYVRNHPVGRYISAPLIFIFNVVQTVYSTQISHGTEIGSGFYLPHVGGIVVNPSVRIGERCYLAHGVTIGKVHAGEKAGIPEIGDDVFLGVGSVVLGRLKVSDNAAVGANSVVIDDVPENCFVAGSPAKLVAKKGAKEILGYE